MLVNNALLTSRTNYLMRSLHVYGLVDSSIGSEECLPLNVLGCLIHYMINIRRYVIIYFIQGGWVLRLQIDAMALSKRIQPEVKNRSQISGQNVSMRGYLHGKDYKL